MTTPWDLHGLETKLREIAECLRGVPVADETVRDLHLSALALKRRLGTWRDEPPPAEVLSDITTAVSDLLDKARAARRMWLT